MQSSWYACLYQYYFKQIPLIKKPKAHVKSILRYSGTRHQSYIVEVSNWGKPTCRVVSIQTNQHRIKPDTMAHTNYKELLQSIFCVTAVDWALVRERGEGVRRLHHLLKLRCYSDVWSFHPFYCIYAFNSNRLTVDIRNQI